MGRPILPVGMHSHGVIAETDEEAYEIGWHYIKKSMDKIGEDRGWPEMSKERFDFEVEHGSYYVGSPETVAQKLRERCRKSASNGLILFMEPVDNYKKTVCGLSNFMVQK